MGSNAGVPNYQRLQDLGQLPEYARKFIPGLVEADQKEKEIAELKKKLSKYEGTAEPEKTAEPELSILKCEVEGCSWETTPQSEVVAKMNIGKHKKAHEKNEG